MSEGSTLTFEREAHGNGIVVLRLEGELVVTNREDLAACVESEIVDGGRNLVVVVDRLTHIDTSGLAMLVHLAALCSDAGGGLAVVGLSVEYEEIRQHLYLDESLVFAASVEDAVAALSR